LLRAFPAVAKGGKFEVDHSCLTSVSLCEVERRLGKIVELTKKSGCALGAGSDKKHPLADLEQVNCVLGGKAHTADDLDGADRKVRPKPPPQNGGAAKDCQG
jgi:hypothetical protein